MSIGVERFHDNARYLPGDSSQQSRGWHCNADGKAGSCSNEKAVKCGDVADQARSALSQSVHGFIEKSFIIYRLLLQANRFTVQEGGRA